MPGSDLLRRLLEAGAAFTDMTSARAESIVQELVRAGELGVDQAQATVQELLDRSRENTERLVTQVRTELGNQLGSLGVASRTDLERLQARIDALESARGEESPARAKRADKAAKRQSLTNNKVTGGKAASKKKIAAKKGAVKKKAAAKKATAKKTAASAGR